jgi:hypothetical protein
MPTASLAAGPVPGGPPPGGGSTGSDDAETAADGDTAEETGGKTSVPAAERRRAASILVGLWRELARDLLVVVLGEERQVRDPALLDDLREAATRLGARQAGSAANGAPPAGAGLGRFLGRLDTAGELLEANVRPELVVDTLLLHWPRTGLRS